MKKSFGWSGLLALLLLSLSARAEWVTTNGPLQATRIIPHLCDQIVLGNDTGINIESKYCQLYGVFNVTEIYIAKLRHKNVTTLMKLDVKVGSIDCRAKVKRIFAHDTVNTFGEIIHTRAGWDVVYVDDCKGDINPVLLGARVGHENVRRMQPTTFEALSLQVKRALLNVDVSDEMGEEGEYRTLKRTFYRVFHTENKDQGKKEQVLGYLGYFQLQSGSQPVVYATVRFNLNGERVGKLDRD